LHIDEYGTPSEPSYDIPEPSGWDLPRIEAALAWQVHLGMPTPQVSGYEYSQSDQPYYLEVWIEKSTMNDVLAPVCRALHASLVPGIGFMSITAAIKMLKRIQYIRAVIGEHKPARIFYISDYDPAGVAMPISVARQLEFYVDKYAPGAKIKLTTLALTEQQVRDYDLPRIPIKAEDKRKGNFEDRRGEGAVELDALEALHPGELRRIVRAALEPYVNESLEDDLQDAEEAARVAVENAWGEATQEEDSEREAIEKEAREICERYEERARDLNNEMQEALAPLRERMEALRLAITTKATQLEVDLPSRPLAAEEDMDEEDWLFDSERDYLKQMAVYRKFRKDGTDPEGVERPCEAPGCKVRFKTRREADRYCCPECRKAAIRAKRTAQTRVYRARKKAAGKTRKSKGQK
jgi:hypothetical protein